MFSARIRGIYSTVLTKILMDAGFRIVQPSERIAERFNIPFDPSPPDVTVKDSEEGGIAAIGASDAVEAAVNAIVGAVKYVFIRRSLVDVHGVYLGRVEGKEGTRCVVDIGNGLRGLLDRCDREPGDMVVVGVAAPLFDRGRLARLASNYRLYGKLVALCHGDPRISFSEHIRDPSMRARLSAIALSKLAGSGLGAHFRSSARFASSDDIAREIDLLLKIYKDLAKSSRSANEPGPLIPGESLVLIEPTSLAKYLMDEVRTTIVPTIRGHHIYKARGASEFVDILEEAISWGCGEQAASEAPLKYLAKKFVELRRVEIAHIKPNGEVLRLAPGEVMCAEHRGGALRLVIKRIMRSPGVYDGLGVEKSEGDVDLMVVESSLPFIVHNYFRSGRWLGSYINVNTPPEIVDGLIVYHDLLADVVVAPDKRPEVIDEDELKRALDAGHIPTGLYEYAISAAADALRRVNELVITDPRSACSQRS